MRLASFREFGASRGMGTARAKGVLACAVLGVPYPLAAVPDTTAVHPATLIVGGGVAGIQAALEIADAGKQVYLVERTGTIGGHMAMFDKTFPTLDCAACILTPKMVAVGQHESIDLMTYAEVEEVSGRPGAYKVKVRKKARRVDVDACVACNACMEVCPVRVPSEFDNGIAERKAIYIPFPQAVPNAYLVDERSCTYVQSDGKKCGACAKKCPKECIDLDQADEIVELEVGNIVLATGYDVFDATQIERYGYGTLPERAHRARVRAPHQRLGPHGRQDRLQDQALQQAHQGRRVGLRRRRGRGAAQRRDHPLRGLARRQPQRLLLARLLHVLAQVRPPGPGEAARGGLLRVLHRHARLRKGLRGVRRAHQGRGHVLRARPHGQGLRDRRPDDRPRRGHRRARSSSSSPSTWSCWPWVWCRRTAPTSWRSMLSLPTDDGWFTELDYNADPTDTERGGVSVAGVCQAPKDIPDTVAQASAVAAGVLKSIATGRGLDSRADLSLADIEARAASLVEV